MSENSSTVPLQQSKLLRGLIKLLVKMSPAELDKAWDLVEHAISLRRGKHGDYSTANSLCEDLLDTTERDLKWLYQHDEELESELTHKGLMQLTWSLYGTLIRQGFAPLPMFNWVGERDKIEILDHIQSQIDSLYLCLSRTDILEKEI